MSLFTPTRAALAAALSLTTLAASAAEWRDFSLAYTYGTRFKEPYVADGGNIAKNIVTARYVDGDSWGGNFFNADVMKSDAVDNKATEVFVMYRRLFDFGKISQRDLSFGPVKSVGATVGFDWNTKNSPEYGSRTRTLVAGPTLVMDVVLAAANGQRRLFGGLSAPVGAPGAAPAPAALGGSRDPVRAAPAPVEGRRRRPPAPRSPAQ